MYIAVTTKDKRTIVKLNRADYLAETSCIAIYGNLAQPIIADYESLMKCENDYEHIIDTAEQGGRFFEIRPDGIR